MSIWAPADSPALPSAPPPPPPHPVLLLTFEFATACLFRVLVLVLLTRLSCVSANEVDAGVLDCVTGSFPSLWRTLILAGGMPSGAEEEDVGGSEGGSLNFPPSRRRVVGAGFAAGSFFWERVDLFKTPAYCRTEPSPSLSSCSSTFTFTAFDPARTPWSRRLNTPVGCQNTSTHCVK